MIFYCRVKFLLGVSGEKAQSYCRGIAGQTIAKKKDNWRLDLF